MRTTLTSAFVIALSLAATGCAKYWTRDQATLADFSKDHRECITSTGVPVVNDPTMVVPREDDYRRCLVSRGWDRRNASWVSVPAGYYRGYEERVEFKPVSIEIPEQPSRPAPAQPEPTPPPAPVATDPNPPPRYVPGR